MEYANKLGSPAVILYGDNEIKSGKGDFKKFRKLEMKVQLKLRN